MYDFHTHTTASDGQYTAAQVVRLAHEKGIERMAVTDHDAIGGVEEGRLEAERLGMDFITGIEISVKGAREMHILGYGIDIACEEAARMCARFRQLRDERRLRIHEYLAQKGVPVEEEAVLRHAGGGLVARPHFARALAEAGYVSTVREAFDRYLGTPDFDRVERPKPTPGEGIGMIRTLGGVAVLAHPSSLQLSGEALERQVRALMDCGLAGIECHYSKFTARQSEEYLSLARKYDLLVTGGSDFHGEKVKPEVELGGFDGSTLYDGGRETLEALRRACAAGK